MNPPASGGQPSSYPSHSPQQQNNPHDEYQQTAAAALHQQQQEHAPSNASSATTASTADTTTLATANGRKKRASGVPGSRGVANLTPDQLAKKRANDREAQRAIRERTRNTIDSLERRIRELEGQQPYQELQRVAQERDRALAECEELKRRLATVASVVGSANGEGGGGPGNVGGRGQQPLHGMCDPAVKHADRFGLRDRDGIELAALTAQQSPLPPLNTTLQQQSPYAQAGAGQQPFEQQHIHPELRSPPSSAAQSSPPNHTPTYSGDSGTSIRKWSPSMEHAPPSQYSSNNGLPFEHQRAPAAHMHSQSNGERLGVNFLLDQNQQPARPQPTSQPASAYAQPQPAPEQPIWARLPNNVPPTCPLDFLLSEVIANRRQQIAAGVSMSEVAGPEYPSFVALDASRGPPRVPIHPVSGLLVDILSKFPDISALPEKVAVLYIMFLIMRWMICTCQPCYERMPEWVKPVAEQLERPHAAWVDHLPWPIMRIRLSGSSQVRFEEFFIPFTTTLSLNWPYPADQVLLPNPAGDPEPVKLNPVFESHLRDLRNWSLGPLFQSTFPELVDYEVRIGERRLSQ